jgi:hypothetical protein
VKFPGATRPSAFSPATHYRHRLAFRLLAIGPRDKSVRMLEIGSGVDEFAEQFLERLPNSRFLGGN